MKKLSVPFGFNKNNSKKDFQIKSITTKSPSIIMMNSEQAFDMLPQIVDIYDKLQIDEYRKKMTKKYAEDKKKGIAISQTDAGIEVVKFVIKNIGKVKEEFFQIVAIIDNKTADEIKKQPITETIATFKEIFTNKELMDFFKSAVQ